jgi:hypothetical protein
MGAQYSPQWQPDRSTHLITPFLNTPKYQQMISSGRGVALRPNYIYDCQQAGRRLEEAGYRLRDIRNYQPSDDDSEDSSDAGSSSSGDDGTTADESGYSSEGSNSEVIEIRSSPEEAEGEEQLSGEYNQDSGAPNQGALVEHQASHLDSTITHDVVPDLSRLPELPMFFTGYSFVLDECSLSLNDLNRIRRLIYEANG